MVGRARLVGPNGLSRLFQLEMAARIRTKLVAEWLLVAILGLLSSCCAQRQASTPTPSAQVARPTPVMTRLPKPMLVGTLIPDTSIPFRVDFDLASRGVVLGKVVWRQDAGARRLDFLLSAPTLHGGFEIESKFSDKGFPRDGMACNWSAADADRVTANCGVALDAGELANDLISTASLGLADRMLPPRSILDVSAQCYGVEPTALSPGGEVCLEPNGRVPLYYANESGDVLVASDYAMGIETSVFTRDLAAHLPSVPTVVTKETLEIPR